MNTDCHTVLQEKLIILMCLFVPSPSKFDRFAALMSDNRMTRLLETVQLDTLKSIITRAISS